MLARPKTSLKRLAFHWKPFAIPGLRQRAVFATSRATHFAGPAALEHDAVQGVLALNQAVAPRSIVDTATRPP
jgi:hypothetical protein